MDEALNPFTAKVIGMVDEAGELVENPEAGADFYNLLIDVGEDDEVEVNQHVLIFGLGPEITDPDGGSSLGHFEIVRGTGKVSSVQVRMAIVRSTRTNTVQYQKPQNINALVAGISPDYGEREVLAPFRRPQIGDFVRFI